MSDDFIVKMIGKKPVLKKPILIEGLPGVGNVARITVDFLIDKLKAKKFMEVCSYYFPNTVFLKEDHSIEMPKMEFYYKKMKSHDLIFVVSVVQPADEYASYAFSDKIIEIAKSMKVEEIITLGGITSRVPVSKPDVFGAYTNKKYVNKLKKCGVRFNRKGSIIIIGAAALMLGLGELKGIDGFALLAETIFEQNKLGIDAAKSILDVLIKYLDLNIKTKDMTRQLKNLGKTTPLVIKKKLIKTSAAQCGPLTYIG